ncbi:MAG: HDIG domain-containing protein [Coriobacteriia bacterium]|nr:HDIG domain-containing protein [Coriobacteriia bacterium]
MRTVNRYNEITSRALGLVPARLKTQVFKGKALIFGLLAMSAVGIVLIGGGAALLGDMLDGTSLDDALVSAMWGAVGAATATVSALVLIPFIRDGLGLAEDIKLMRAASPEHPLMRELMSRAPGTYAHSVAAANLAEAGAEEIGADALIARVGAYFHDVGKIRRPIYFFENQSNCENPHDEAKPSLSALIITAHVRDGMALGKEYRLPERIQAIIRQHHGTALVSYFYHKAAATDAAVYEADFRYQGEKPQSREAALVMLADSCEAAVRAIKVPVPEQVESTVRAIVDDKVADGQLDEAGLRPSDLERIIKTYSRMLVSMYHGRVEYPKADHGGTGVIGADQNHQPSGA